MFKMINSINHLEITATSNAKKIESVCRVATEGYLYVIPEVTKRSGSVAEPM